MGAFARLGDDFLLHQCANLARFLHAACQVGSRRIQDGREDEDHVAGKEDRDQRRDLVRSPESKRREQERVDDLADQR